MLEQNYADLGYRSVFGIDEAGRGPWAGPLVAAAVALPIQQSERLAELVGVKDSKKMTKRQRENAVAQIKAVALAWGIGIVHVDELNEIHQMTEATRLAMQRALEQASANFNVQADFLLLDYMRLPNFPPERQASFKRGESVSLSIAAASVLAKTWRDHHMREIAKDYPAYGFDAHKGYGTPAHIAALKTYGVTPLHRLHYKPIQLMLEGHGE